MTGELLGEGDWQKEPDTKPERLLSLTLALLSNSVGLSKEELFRSVRGYSLAIDDGEDYIKTNPYPWNLRANMLWLESPAGVGWSVGETHEDL